MGRALGRGRGKEARVDHQIYFPYEWARTSPYTNLSVKGKKELRMIEESMAAAKGKRSVPRLTASEWWVLAVLAALQFTHHLDYMIMMPLLPHFEREMGISPQQFGFLVSAYAFSAGLAGLLAAL